MDQIISAFTGAGIFADTMDFNVVGPAVPVNSLNRSMAARTSIVSGALPILL